MSSQSKLDLQSIVPSNRSSNWTVEKQKAVDEAMKMYPHIPQIAIEVAYDFSLKYDDNTDMEKYLKGEFVSHTARKRLRKQLNPKNVKLERNTYEDGTVLNNVEIKKSQEQEQEPVSTGNIENKPVVKTWYNLF